MNTIMLYFGGGMGNPIDMEARRLETELKMRNRGKDPELPPEKEPGDIYILLGILLGAVIGGIIGFFIGASGIVPSSLIFLLIIAGVIAGGIAGTLAGSAIKKRARQKTGNDSGEGPMMTG